MKDDLIVKYIRLYYKKPLNENIIDHESILKSITPDDGNILHNTPKEIIENIKQAFKIELLKNKIFDNVKTILQSTFDTNAEVFILLIPKAKTEVPKLHDEFVDGLLGQLKSIDPRYNTDNIKQELLKILERLRQKYEPILRNANGPNDDPNNRNDKIGYYNEYSPKEHYHKI